MKSEEIANLFYEHEMLFNSIYLDFVKRFPVYAEFWQKMADEEISHAESMRWLRERLQHDELLAERIDIASLRRSLFYLKEQVALIEQIEPSHVAAVGIALDLEETLLEKKLFAVRAEDPPDVREFFQLASLELNQHISRLRDEKRRIKLDKHVK